MASYVDLHTSNPCVESAQQASMCNWYNPCFAAMKTVYLMTFHPIFPSEWISTVTSVSGQLSPIERLAADWRAPQSVAISRHWGVTTSTITGVVNWEFSVRSPWGRARVEAIDWGGGGGGGINTFMDNYSEL